MVKLGSNLVPASVLLTIFYCYYLLECYYGLLFQFYWILVGTLFINISGIYCFGTGLPISPLKDVYPNHHFNIINLHCKYFK